MPNIYIYAMVGDFDEKGVNCRDSRSAILGPSRVKERVYNKHGKKEPSTEVGPTII